MSDDEPDDLIVAPDDDVPGGDAGAGLAHSSPQLTPGEPPPARLEIEPGRSRDRRRSWLVNGVELLITVAVAVVVAIEVQAHVVKPFRIPSGSMIPTLIPGQRILVDRLDTHPKLGDVVVFRPPIGAESTDPICGDPDAGAGHAKPCDKPLPDESSTVFVKRVVGLPGDRISIRDGIVYRNGTPEKLAYTAQQAGEQAQYHSCAAGGIGCNFRQTITVPAGDYYMMGDNRGDSLDSRYWGPEPQKWIIGVAFFTYWPIDRIGTL